ncbi:MAG: type II toxin-antitoxin system VapC family toxin [Alphaproteobacteria bacterium]|nr:type II toxin-antitoxin system VapC family toxin [Alphaproteobacteria bacterium]
MIVDSSAILAVLKRESDALKYATALSSKQALKMSAATYVELGIVADRDRDPIMSRLLDHVVRDAEIEIVPFDEAQARIAREAYRDFGKGSGHRARLNLGDCFAYALAKVTGEALLYKGSDFQHTDVTSALR